MIFGIHLLRAGDRGRGSLVPAPPDFRQMDDYGWKGPLIRVSGLRSVLLASLDLSDTPSVRSVPMIIFAISRSEPGVRPYPTPAFTSKRPILKSTTAYMSCCCSLKGSQLCNGPR